MKALDNDHKPYCSSQFSSIDGGPFDDTWCDCKKENDARFLGMTKKEIITALNFANGDVMPLLIKEAARALFIFSGGDIQDHRKIDGAIVYEWEKNIEAVNLALCVYVFSVINADRSIENLTFHLENHIETGKFTPRGLATVAFFALKDSMTIDLREQFGPEFED